ncbi:MAG: hypothetical protein WC716_06985 [Chitinophagaceae bacterium]|jgi:hypothetical protein
MTNKNDVVMSIENVWAEVSIEDEHHFQAYLSIGLAPYGDFFVEIKFEDLTMDGMAYLAKLSRLPQRIKIGSSLLQKEGYNFSHIVVEKFSANSVGSLTWEGLSDDPENYKGIHDPWLPKR